MPSLFGGQREGTRYPAHPIPTVRAEQNQVPETWPQGPLPVLPERLSMPGVDVKKSVPQPKEMARFDEQLARLTFPTDQVADPRVAAAIQPETAPRKSDQAIAAKLELIPDLPVRREIENLVLNGKLVEAQQLSAEIRANIEERFQIAKNGEEEKLLSFNETLIILEDLLNKRIADPQTYIRPRDVRVESTNRNVNSEKELTEFLGALHTETEKDRFKVLVHDLQASETVHDLKALTYDRTEHATGIRSTYQNSKRFRHLETANDRSVMKLYINAGDRIIIGFDGASRSNEILFSGNPHQKDDTYKPEVESKIHRFLGGGK